MSLESEIFTNLKPDYRKLIMFGFKKTTNSLVFIQTIPDTDLVIKVEIKDNQRLVGQVIDTNFNEEYINFRSSNLIGSFAASIKDKYQTLLHKIADDCFIFDLVVTGQEWIVPANPRYFDIDQAFKLNQTISWKQSTHIRIGDIVYLYVAAPVSALKYKCLVTAINQPYYYQDQNLKIDHVMQLRRIESLNTRKYSFNNLKKYGIKAIRGPRRATKALTNELAQNSKPVN
ncbi:MmcQ protein [Lactobacillus sp. UCMA15818]|uniref:MmcQ protein n=1 Tax=Lactobacillaceae TaxID=33958 RepID=UPI0025B1BA77|nr:MmcQ protein [Lactobacillus sp. UCMA15818]